MRNPFTYIHWISVVLAFSGIFISTRKTSFEPKGFDPDAGLVRPLNTGAKIVASSNQTDSYKVMDGDQGTAWVSEAPLPEGFVKNKTQNMLLGKRPELGPGTKATSLDLATDGDLQNTTHFSSSGEKVDIRFPLAAGRFFSISVKCQASSDIYFSVENQAGEHLEIGTISPADNYKLVRFEKPIPDASTLHISAKGPFDVFEVAALATLPKESLTFQFDKTEKIGVLKGKCWAGDGTATATEIFTSEDGQAWQWAAALAPDSPHELMVNFPEREARFVKIEHTLAAKDWNKVFLWEIKLYDANGPFGKKPPANQGAVTLREMLGVNGYWSWGTDQYSHLLGEKEGPRRYASVASHARNYHDMTWDVTHPDQEIDFSKMKTNGTPAKDWVNWDLEYANWRKAGLDIQASLQFYRFDPKDWKTPEESARKYAFAFAKHFGNRQGNGLVCTIEAGNEPWKYTSDLYLKILNGIISGAKEADPNIEVFPCALQAADPDMEKTDVFKNYIGARINEKAAKRLDGVNTHVYSYLTGNDGKRKGVHPEHPLSSFWEILNLIQWRNHNMPGKKIYLSEWGWDSPGGGEDCTHPECVSENAASAYAVRGALIASRLGMERATWYYYANEKAPASLYTRSGLTSSVTAGFQKKKPFYGLESLVKNLGNAYFLKVEREDETAWAYLFGNTQGHPTHLVAWLPVNADATAQSNLLWASKSNITQAIRLDGETSEGIKLPVPVRRDGAYSLALAPYPTVFGLK